MCNAIKRKNCHLYSHWIDGASDFKASLLKHHHGRVVDAGTYEQHSTDAAESHRTARSHTERTKKKASRITKSTILRIHKLTFGKDEDWEFAFVLDMIAQPANEMVSIGIKAARTAKTVCFHVFTFLVASI